MKTLLIAINSQFIHSNLAVAYLRASCNHSCGEVKVLEFSVNETLQHIFAGIARENPDVVAFSCYIWNIEPVAKLADDIKKFNPGIIIIAGGPEVSFDGGGLLSSGDSVDYLISGEGDEKFPSLLSLLNTGKTPDEEFLHQLRSLSTVQNLDLLPLPYHDIAKGSLKNRIAYVEASRGCPFHCAYCISSTTRGVRYFPLEKVYEALQILVDSGSGIIKFVDRTFNANSHRALDIWHHIRRFAHQNVVFHFEIDPGLLDEKTLACLAEMPSGLIQIEAGIQSIHAKTLKAVERPWKIDKAFANLQKVLSFGNIHVHVDLIAGLPYEGYAEFIESFNRVYDLKAHHFQLGFLKMLRGSAIRENASLYGYSYRAYPPYEIISNHDLSSAEYLAIKDIEACMDLFYNSGRFVTTLQVLTKALPDVTDSQTLQNSTGAPFRFYESLAVFMRRNGCFDRAIKASALYCVLFQYIQESCSAMANSVISTMRFDYLRAFKNPTVPHFMQQGDALTGRKKQEKMNQYMDQLQHGLPRLSHVSLDTIWNDVFIADFNFPKGTGFPKKAVIAFDFGDLCPVTGLAGAYLLQEISEI